jgi:hypothetical protein
VTAVLLEKLISMFLKGSPRNGFGRPLDVSALSRTGGKLANAAARSAKMLLPEPVVELVLSPTPLEPGTLSWMAVLSTPLTGIRPVLAVIRLGASDLYPFYRDQRHAGPSGENFGNGPAAKGGQTNFLCSTRVLCTREDRIHRTR